MVNLGNPYWLQIWVQETSPTWLPNPWLKKAFGRKQGGLWEGNKVIQIG